MQTIEKTKRRYFTTAKKLQILEELKKGSLTHSDLARKYKLHPVTLYQWKRTMSEKKLSEEIDYEQILKDYEKIKAENDQLKKAVAEMAIDKQILQTANDIYKKKYRQQQLKSPKKSSKK